MIRITVPATTSNFGSGFDSLGLALSPRARFEVVESSSYGVLSTKHRRPLNMPYDEENRFIVSYKEARKRLGLKELPITVDVSTSFKMGAGLGSSATAVIGGIIAAYEMEGVDFNSNIKEIAELAVELEGHPDNALPALLGGFVVGTSSPVLWSQLPFPFRRAVVVTPAISISTESSRKRLPKTVGLATAAHNIQRAALLIAALQEASTDLSADVKEKMKEAVNSDLLHQPYRLAAIRGATEAIEAAYEEGAAMAFLSGSGPSIIAFSEGNYQSIAKKMKEAFLREGLDAIYLIVEVSDSGAQVSHLSSPS